METHSFARARPSTLRALVPISVTFNARDCGATTLLARDDVRFRLRHREYPGLVLIA